MQKIEKKDLFVKTAAVPGTKESAIIISKAFTKETINFTMQGNTCCFFWANLIYFDKGFPWYSDFERGG